MTAVKDPKLWTAVAAAVVTALVGVIGAPKIAPDWYRPDPARGTQVELVQQELRFLSDRVAERDAEVTQLLIEIRHAISAIERRQLPPDEWRKRIRNMEEALIRLERHGHPELEFGSGP